MTIEEEYVKVLIARLNHLRRLTQNLEKAGIRHGWAKEMAALQWLITGLTPEPMNIEEVMEPNQFLVQKGTDMRVNMTRAKRDDKIMEMSKKGYSHKEIAKQVGIHPTTVYKILRKMRPQETVSETRRNKSNQKTLDRLERDNQILQMSIDGLSVKEIATLKKIPHGTVYGILRKAKGK